MLESRRLAGRTLNSAQQKALDDALDMAVNARDEDMMASAMESGASADLLLFRGIQNEKPEWVKLAVGHGADVNASMKGLSYGSLLTSSRAYPPMIWLTQSFNAAVGDYLLSKGAKVDALSPEGNSALMVAVKQRKSDAIKWLAARGADPLLPCAGQEFPLKTLQEDSNWYDSRDKLPLVKAMMDGMKKNAGTQAPANDPAPVTTAENIEIIRPLELKKKPRTGFDL